MTTVTMVQLTEYLEQFGWKFYEPEEEETEKEGIIKTAWRSSPETRSFTMSIDPMVERGCLSFKVHWIAQAPRDSTPADRLSGLLMTLAWINYRIILGKFSYDPNDGEVRFSIDVPIDENDFCYAQFEHTLRIMISTVEEWEPRFRSFLEGAMSLDELLAA